MNKKTLLQQPTCEPIKIKHNETYLHNTTMKSQVLTADVPCLQMNNKNVICSFDFEPPNVSLAKCSISGIQKVLKKPKSLYFP